MRAVEADVLVIGAGIAGLAAALRLARDRERQIVLLTREAEPEEGASRYAQGGIATLGPDDSAELLVQDILQAGAGLSLKRAAEILAQEGPELVRKVLIEEAGVPFDRTPEGDLHYTREGGHSRARILHVGDRTGEAIVRALHRLLKEFANVKLVTRATAVDLITFPHHARDPLTVYEPITCHGAYVLDQRTGEVHRYLAGATVLATGGLGRIYRYTTNPPGARGDGLAMADRAGARVINAEYVQFHPTTLAVPEGENFLISEAVRGEGGRLFTPDGSARRRHFMEEYAPGWGDLAPRDLVSRAIHREMTVHGYPHVLLDVSRIEGFPERFPTIYKRCLELGISLPEEPIPVVPAAHYFCGGIWTDEWGRTTIRNLYAVGEVACTGVHGANRLASTSLLEGLVFGDRAGRQIARTSPKPISPEAVPPWEPARDGAPADPALIHRDWRSIQYTMWYYAGLSRDGHRLERAIRDLEHLRDEIIDFYRRAKLDDSLLGLRNGVQAALIVAEAARRNRKSRGVHFREDAPG
ncbi:MAG: L-aspartate oxidase [Candidatus Acetothermia bacterium]|jgi:L-aspartate oxidase|nr:L-aspartate oxidase [Candidatus Acetothermia bacterium]MDH7506016.1 L-aspartate oxidase [Candidatus Acetothermia bacterium]